jgi:hypothetical protein
MGRPPLQRPAPPARELHFKTGVMGLLARCFAAIRAAGDPLDQTLVLPPLIFLVFVGLHDLGRVGDSIWLWCLVLVLPASVAGVWVGATVGLFRAMLRGILIGAIEFSGFITMVNETLDQPGISKTALGLIYLNSVCFWFFGSIGMLSQRITLISEEDWQEGVPRRANIHKVIRIAMGLQKREGQTTGVGIAVWCVWLGVAVLAGYFARAFGFSPISFMHSGKV